MYVDSNTTFGEALDVSTAGVIGDAIDIGSVYGIGSQAPWLHIVPNDGSAVSGAVLQICASEDGETAGDVLMEIPANTVEADAEGNDGVYFSGRMNTIPEATARYIVLNVATAGSGTINAYLLNNAPNVRTYPGV